MPKNTEINIGDTVYTYCDSSRYSIFSGKVIEIHKNEKLKCGKRIVQNQYCVIRENSKYTWGTYHPFLSEKEAALDCLRESLDRMRFHRKQLKCCEDSVKAMKEILKKYDVEVEE